MMVFLFQLIDAYIAIRVMKKWIEKLIHFYLIHFLQSELCAHGSA